MVAANSGEVFKGFIKHYDEKTVNDFLEQNSGESLQHYGKRGMKWGVRKVSNTTKDSKKSKSKFDISKMSDEDLRKVVNRMQLEQQFSNLTKKSSTTNKGKEFAKTILKDFAKAQILTVGAIGSKLLINRLSGNKSKNKYKQGKLFG